MEKHDPVILFKCLEFEQPIGKFYLGVMRHTDLLKISFADIRRIEERDIERIVGIQRPLSKNRVKELNAYVNNVDATFPTGVILAISSEDAEYLPESSSMKIRKDEAVAKIIDGQHRIAGLNGFVGNDPFFVSVTIFVDMDIEDQAMVFATINIKQTKVNKSLVYDLYEYASTRSPQKTTHNIARLLNKKSGSPFLGKIKILGVAYGPGDQTITQATFVESLLRYISKDANLDRNEIKRGGQLNQYLGKEGLKYFCGLCF